MPRRLLSRLPYAREARVLAALLRGSPPGAIDDAKRFAAATVHHNVVESVLRAVDRRELALPATCINFLSEHQWRLLALSARLRVELRTLEPTLAAATGVRPILLKGPAVSDRLYRDRRLRPFVDLDLLLPRSALREAVVAVRGCGYEELEQFRPGFAETHGHDIHLRRSVGGGQLDLELHWRISDDPIAESLSYDVIRRTAVELEVADTCILIPSPPEELLVLAVHLLNDRSKKLAWINDIVLAARRADEEQWNRAFALAEELGLGWALNRALDYCAAALEFGRERPMPASPPPPWGPLRAVDSLNIPASTHIGRLALQSWRVRVRYLRDVLFPTRAGLDGTVGGDGAPTWKLVLRHVRRVVGGVSPRR